MASTMASPRRRASLVASPTPQSPGHASGIPRPQSASGRYRSGLLPSSFTNSITTPEPTSTDDADKGQVRVVLRLRPSEPEDPAIPARHRAVLVHPTSQTEVRVSVDPAALAGSTSLASSSKRHPTFTFDRVLGEPASQVDLYNAAARERVDEFLKGFNVTFLAYGQTSSGKSYSMGTTGEDDYPSETSGLIPRTVETIFRRAEEIRQSSGPGASWECRVSFLELYNEDLIDLLANTNAPTNVSIRENTDGRIVWSGVREIKVQNVNEVMALLHEGSIRRRTGETNMNQTSSRSHAIFSLTLVQSRRAVVNETPTKRPMSVMSSRSSTPSRPPPSSYSKLNRPNSVHMGSSDDMVVLTSKFNMVDLAGSERLKRTGAQAERMKEGISINSGLLALGNVISALAEPSKNRGHVPYRDSKLTRLLQDSIGGNAMTTMIACVSPLEYNISETINTINYASRARKIKNQVSKNQTEVGWDDIEYLRNQVVKLRAKIANADGGDAPTRRDAAAIDDDALQRQIIELTDKLADLEDEFSHLQDQYFQKCREIVALSDPDLLEDDKLRQFNETIEPVVLEYEKVVASLNGQIAELRAEAAVSLQASEDQASELTKARAVLLQHESYKEELESRIAKLSQRNDSSEAYIRDLETKCREYTENDDRKSEEITTLTQEIQVLKTEVTKSNTYITELEQRVSTSDSSSRDLTAAVDHHTTQAEARDKQIAELENKITMLTNEHAASNEENVTLLLEQIESRDRQIEALEARIQQSEQLTHEPKALTPTLAPSTPPDTPPVLRTIVEDADPLAAADVEEATPATEAPQVPSEVDRLRQENLDLMNRLREYELSYEQLRETPTTPTLDPPDEELEDEEDKQSKRGSTGESSESDTTLETPRLASRTVSPLEYSVRQRSEPRLLRPLSLSQGFSSYAYNPSSPRYSWSAPSNGIYERSPRQSPKRQSIPFDSKPLRSVQSLEIDLALLQKAVTDRDAQLQQREVEIKYLKKKLENSASPSTTQINADEVIERLRKDHSDQVDKIRDEHQRGMNALDNEYHSSVGALRNQLEQLKATQADELHFAKESHKTDLTELQNRHAKEIATEMTTSKDMKTALEAAWAELSATGARHQAERDSLISVHHAEIAEMEKRHASVIASLQAELNSSSTQLQTLSGQLTAITEAREQAEQELAAREDDLALREQELSVRSTDNVPMEEHNIVVSAMEEMEAALTAAEDEKRQLKNKAQLEHSKLRDEHDLELMSLRNKISDLEKQLLESRNRDSRATDRSSRTKLPPIGPPPTAPLPPVPAGREAVLSPTPTSRGDESPRSSASHDRPASSEDPDRLLQLESQIDKFKADLSKKETDFMELRKSNSKLKVRVDDTNRENTDLKRERDNLRRDVVQMKNDLADQEYERIADRQRLEGAKLEAQQYKAKLDRMVDAKVTKRSDQKLKCF